jgi:hypothetical protein
MFGSKRDCSRLHTGKLHDSYLSPNTILVTRCMKMRWAGHVARMGKKRLHTKFWYGKLKKMRSSEDLGIGGRIILKGILKK